MDYVPQVLFNALVDLVNGINTLVNRITSPNMSKTIHQEVHEIKTIVKQNRRIKVSSL